MIRYLLLLSLLLLCSCHKPEKTLRIVATPLPHAAMLEEVAKPLLAQEGIELDIIVVEDYHLPNRALAEGEVDANFFQHRLFLEAQERDCGYHLAVLAPVHTEPMGLYSSKFTALAGIRRVAIPADPSNRARALKLLAAAGLHPEEILEVDGFLLAQSLPEVDAAAIPTNYALQIGLHPAHDALFLEAADSPYANIVVVRDPTKPELQALKKAMTGPEMRSFILSYFDGALIPAF